MCIRDSLDTGRLTVTGSFPTEYAGRKIILFVTDPAVDLNDSTIADSEKYFGIRQGFINEDGSYRFDNPFYARPGIYQVNVIADTMVTPITTPLTVTGTYYAVSYTHLDVYKRQPQFQPLSSIQTISI